tara:strand:+ start:36413 stop:37441 length:1029 start_codon:yes stop_codon:yes gene_type:complete
MAYSTGSATDLGDLLSKLDIFLVANGWTQDDFDDGATTASEGFANWTKNTMSIGMKWIANAPNNLSIHQATAHSGSGFPGTHTNDSGNGYNNAFGTDANLETERCVNTIADGPFVSYHFFEQDASPAYVHVVVEIESEVFRHFGWGEMDKFNDWTGGDYCYGHYQEEGTSSTPIDTTNWILFPAAQAQTATTLVRRCPTIQAQGLPHQLAAERWLMHAGNINSQSNQANWVDTAGENKQLTHGGFQGGPDAYPLGQFESDVSTGHIPMYPLTIWTLDFPNNFTYFLGSIPDIRGLSMFNFTPGQEVTIGSDVWVLFPASRRTEDGIINRTYYSGIAYKKVTA